MKIALFLLAAFFISAAYSFAEAGKPPAPDPSEFMSVTIEEVVSHPGQYDGKRVTLEGKVTKIDRKRSPKGEMFTVFKLRDTQKNEVGVYVEDESLSISKGDQVRIAGRFWKEKSYFLYKIKNVIKARTVDIIRQSS